VGHVDDTHDAKRDRQADRGEQQHAAEADAFEKTDGEADQPKSVFDRRERPIGGSTQVAVALRGCPELIEKVLDLRIGGAAERLYRGQLLGLGARKEPGCRKAPFHYRPDRRVLLSGNGLFEQHALLGRRMPQRILGGG